MHAIQIVSVVCLIVAGGLAVAELWPRNYELPEPESDCLDERIDELVAHYSQYTNAESHIVSAFVRDEIGWAKKRIATNQSQNREKALFLQWSFWMTTSAFIGNLITLFSFTQRLS